MQIAGKSRSLVERVSKDGFAILPNVISERETSDLIVSLQRGDLPRSRAGMRHAMRNAAVAALTLDIRLLELAREVLGARGVSSTSNTGQL